MNWDRLSQFSTAADLLRAEEATRQHRATFPSYIIDKAQSLAELAQASTLQAAIDPFRASVGPFTDKLLHLESLDVLRSPAHFDAFVQASAISNVFSASDRVDRRMREAIREFSLAAVPVFDDLNGYRQFLNASGLVLPHWPSVRLLTIGEKRRRLRAKLKNNSEQTHVRKGKSLVQRYELTFRDILSEVMERSYGENWAESRLPLCECKDLLGKWRKRGGQVMAHADYAHYERIMTFPAHFEEVFGVGFEDRGELAAIVKKAGALRAALFHFHPFSPEDLRDLRVTWLTIETGLLALTSDYELDGWT
jgi:hypothetical protein